MMKRREVSKSRVEQQAMAIPPNGCVVQRAIDVGAIVGLYRSSLGPESPTQGFAGHCCGADMTGITGCTEEEARRFYPV